MKNRPEPPPRAFASRPRSERKRTTTPDSNRAFLLALADALRDILRDERRRAA